MEGCAVCCADSMPPGPLLSALRASGLGGHQDAVGTPWGYLQHPTFEQAPPLSGPLFKHVGILGTGLHFVYLC